MGARCAFASRMLREGARRGPDGRAAAAYPQPRAGTLKAAAARPYPSPPLHERARCRHVSRAALLMWLPQRVPTGRPARIA
ncbi:protein of unknown function [Burkholderia multivorans]